MCSQLSACCNEYSQISHDEFGKESINWLYSSRLYNFTSYNRRNSRFLLYYVIMTKVRLLSVYTKLESRIPTTVLSRFYIHILDQINNVNDETLKKHNGIIAI